MSSTILKLAVWKPNWYFTRNSFQEIFCYQDYDMINFKISKTYFLISRKIIAYTVSFVVVVVVFQLLSDRTKKNHLNQNSLNYLFQKRWFTKMNSIRIFSKTNNLLRIIFNIFVSTIRRVARNFLGQERFL